MREVVGLFSIGNFVAGVVGGRYALIFTVFCKVELVEVVEVVEEEAELFTHE